MTRRGWRIKRYTKAGFLKNKSIRQMKMAYAMTLPLNIPKGIANGQTQLFI
jgi:hypothetical protein